jgi:hypothetical protein
MWVQRVISWFRALFSAPTLDEADDAPHAGAPTFDALAPTVEPEFTRRQLLYPRDPLKTFGLGPTQDTFPLEPPLYESPKTIPLMRLSPQVDLRYEEPTQAAPVASEPPASLVSREPTQPVASEPLSANLQRLSELPDSLDNFDQMDDFDETTRRLLFLRRLVRQRVYNEGFSLDETPEQYHHSLGLSDHTGETSSQN